MCVLLEHSLRCQKAWVQILAPTLISFVILGKWLNVLEPQFFHMENAKNTKTSVPGLFMLNNLLLLLLPFWEDGWDISVSCFSISLAWSPLLQWEVSNHYEEKSLKCPKWTKNNCLSTFTDFHIWWVILQLPMAVLGSKSLTNYMVFKKHISKMLEYTSAGHKEAHL